MTSGRRRRLSVSVVSAALAVTLTGCLQPADEGGSGPGGLAFAPGGTADGDGKVTIMGAFGGGEQAGFEASIKQFEADSGIEIDYVADKDIATTIKQKAAAGDTPDIALFPQPGGLLDLAADGQIEPIDTFLDFDAIEKTLVPGILDSARLNGRYYGAPMRMAVKSLVFYPKAAYEQAGFDKAPKSLEEMATIGDQMKADGQSPWCMGWQDAQATGWVGTDWVEDLVLRMWGPDVYDEWVSHDIPFNDPRIVEAIDRFRQMTLVDDETYGGTKAVLNTPFGDSFNPAFANPPKCWWHRQGNFITGFLPDAIQADLDNKVGLFAFPADTQGWPGLPMLGGGDIAALFNGNDEDAIEVMKFLSSDKFGTEWAAAGGYLSPHQSFPIDVYPDAITKQIAQIVSTADAFRFDGSDLMPKEVGTDTFWKGMVDLANGKSAEDVATEIEESWPAE